MTTDQLEKLVAPVALYPDKLLPNILRAAAVPIQIVQADRYLDEKPSGGDADEAQTKDWDPSVQALLHYPKVVMGPNSIVHERDFGVSTPACADRMVSFQPDRFWNPADSEPRTRGR